MTLGCNSFMGFISDPFVMFAALVTMTSGRVGKTCRCMIREKTGNVVAHLLSYLLHLMFMALWRRPVICRCPYGSAWVQGSTIPTTLSSAKHHRRIPPVVEIDSLLFGWRVYDPGQTNPNTTQGKKLYMVRFVVTIHLTCNHHTFHLYWPYILICSDYTFYL